MILFSMIIGFLAVFLFCKKFFKNTAVAIIGGIVASIISIPLLPYGYFLCLCQKNSGQKIYKTVKQWKAENPNAWENLQEISWENVKYGDIPEYYKQHNIPQYKKFRGKKYELSKGSNQRVLDYGKSKRHWSGIILHNRHIFYDNLKNEILIEQNYYRYYIEFFVGGYDCGETQVHIRDFSNPKPLK